MTQTYGTPDGEPVISQCDADLAVQREIIDEVDAQLVELINRRAIAATEIGRIKMGQGLEIYVGSREEEVLSKVAAANKGGIVPDEDIRLLFGAIMKTSRAAQQRLKDESEGN